MELPPNQPEPIYYPHLGKLGRLPSDLLVKIFTDPSNFGTCNFFDACVYDKRLRAYVMRLLKSCKAMYYEDTQLTQKLAMGTIKTVAELKKAHASTEPLVDTLQSLATPASMRFIKQIVEEKLAERSQNKTTLSVSNEPVSVTKMLLDLDLASKVDLWLILSEITIQKFELLLTHQKRPDINCFLTPEGGNILHFFVRNYHYFPDRNLQIARLLLKHGIDFKKRDDAGLTPLEHAHTLRAGGMIILLQRAEYPEKSGCMGIM
jgi:hypothetical protein